MAKKVTQIQNGWTKKIFQTTVKINDCSIFFFCLLPIQAGLGEFKIRDLNDEINRLLKEKYAWEDRILELGGPDYKVCIV